jgi:hypothetical protein
VIQDTWLCGLKPFECFLEVFGDEFSQIFDLRFGTFPFDFA